MSSAEKLFFKRNFASSKDADQRLYLRLFDAIAAQKKYDEASLLKKFHPSFTKKNIAFQKHYLQHQICDALIHYDGRNNESQEIYNQILLIRIYRKKRLLDEAHAVWQKAVARARKTESFALLNLLKKEFEKMILLSSVHTHFDELHSIFKKNVITYTEYAKIITLRDIYTETLLCKRKAHFDLDDKLKEKITDLLKKVNENNEVFPTHSFWFRHYQQMTKATLLYLLTDIPAAFSLFQEVFKDWKKNGEYIKTDGEYYIELLYMINYAGTLNGAYDYVTATFNDPINDLIQDPLQQVNFEAIKFLALNKVYNKTGCYNEVENLVNLTKIKYKQWETSLNTELNRSINLSLGIAFFALEQYNEALYFTKRAITLYKDGTREEHLAVSQILLLLISYNLNNSVIFDAQYRTTYVYFYKRKKKHPFETALIQCLHRSFYMHDNKSKILEYQKALDVFEQNKDDVVQQMSFAIFNYPGWLISKVQRISYRQYVERKVKEEANR